MADHYKPYVMTNVLEDLKSGLSCAEAARRNHVCVATVYRWRNTSLGASLAKQNRSMVKAESRAEARAEALLRLAKGETATALAAEYGVSAVTIHNWVRKANQTLLAKTRYMLDKMNKREDLPEDTHPKLTAAIAVLERFL